MSTHRLNWCTYPILTMDIIKGWSPLSNSKSRNCKIRFLSIRSIYQLFQQITCFQFIRANEKKFNWLELFSITGEWYLKVNTTQRISAKIDFCLNFDAINFEWCRQNKYWTKNLNLDILKSKTLIFISRKKTGGKTSEFVVQSTDCWFSYSLGLQLK